jgi:hypothetical protein
MRHALLQKGYTASLRVANPHTAPEHRYQDTGRGMLPYALICSPAFRVRNIPFMVGGRHPSQGYGGMLCRAATRPSTVYGGMPEELFGQTIIP